MRSWWVWAAAAVLAASPALAREHRGGSDGGGRHSGGDHSGGDRSAGRSGGDRSGGDRGGHAKETHSSEARASSNSRAEQAPNHDNDRRSGSGSHSAWSGARSDSHSSAERYHPSSRNDGDRRWTSSRSYGSSSYGRSSSYGYSSYGHTSSYGRGRSYYSYSSHYRRPFYVSFFYRSRPSYYYHQRYYYPRYVYGGSSYYYDDEAYYNYDNDAAVRVLVEPSETQVYVDGYYAGTADDFDGLFQRLYLTTGRHQITLKLDGFRSWSAQVYGTPGHTIKLHHDMLRGVGDEEPGDVSVNREEEEAEARDMATLHLDVQPTDAAVYIDGEICNLAQKDIPVPEGRHSVEVVRPGYRSAEQEFDARAGRTVEVQVDLVKSDARASDNGRPY